MYNVTLRCVHATFVVVEKSKSIALHERERERERESVCVRACVRARARVCVCVCVVLGMQCARAILTSVACPTVQYFSPLSLKRHDFPKTVAKQKMHVSIFSTAFVRNISF